MSPVQELRGSYARKLYSSHRGDALSGQHGDYIQLRALSQVFCLEVGFVGEFIPFVAPTSDTHQAVTYCIQVAAIL